MTGYEKILVAVDLTEDAKTVLRQARRLCGPDDSSQLHLIHVSEHPVTGHGNVTSKNHRVGEIHLRQEIFPRLQALADDLDAEQLHIAFGDAAEEVSRLANALGAHIIVTGSHGERGIRRLLGTTANSIAHHANCDVLTVRIAH